MTTLYSLCAQAGCTNGDTPYPSLVQATNGNFYGASYYGGVSGDGTLFSLALGLGPFVETLPTSGAVGVAVTILGSNLTGATSLTFNGTTAAFTVVSSSEITTTVPVGATTGIVQVTTPNGTLKSNVAFQVTGAAQQVATPTFNPAASTYSAPQSVTLGDTTTGAVIYYTTNGATPTTASTQYAGAITVNSTETIEAIAIASGYSTSAVGTATYTITLPIASVATTSLTFGAQNTGTTSASQPVALNNTGNAVLTITSIVASGDFSQTNNCGSSVAAGSSCTINVTFTPTTTGTSTYALTITDNSNGVPGSTQTVSLTGSGTAPVAGVSTTGLTFAALLVKSTSNSQAVTLSNTGNLALAVASITTSGNFAETNNCGSSVAASGSCTINVTFTPLAGGPLTGALTITDNTNNTTGSTQTVSLTGTGQDFTVGTPSGSSPSATVAPGSPATYTLSVGGEGGLSGTVSFTCTGAPSEATCTVSPNPVTAGSSATSVTVTVTTSAPSVSVHRPRPHSPIPPLSSGLRGPLMLALALAAMTWALGRRKQLGASRWQSALFPLVAGLLLTLALAGGGGGGGNTTPTNPGTPAGTSTLTITGTAGSGSSALSHSVTLTLIVS